MKLRTIIVLSIIATTTLLISCNDTLDKLGFTVQPGNDKVTVGTDTVYLSSSTIQVDSVFSKTKYPILGEYIDPVFGSIRSDYIGEFYFPETMEFKKDAKIDSVRLSVEYTSMIGDSLAPMQLAVYKVTEVLPKGKKYTNFNPEIFADMSKPLGVKTFTGKNNSYRTEVYYSGTTSQEIKIYEINTPLPIEIGQSFLDEYHKEGHGALIDTETFREFFPGVYVTTNFGNSSILNVNLTSLKVYYNYLDEKGSSQQTDTTRSTVWNIYITPEVTQMNRISNKNDNLIQVNDSGTFIKSPAGVNTEVMFPIADISNKLSNSALNQAKLVVYTVPNVMEDERIKLSPPDNLLLINRDSVKQFFENGKLHDNLTSFVATYDSSTQSYNFGNISALINYYNSEHKKDQSKPLNQTYQLIPVDLAYASSSGIYSQGTVVTEIYNQMKPTATMINNKKDKLRLDIIYTSF